MKTLIASMVAALALSNAAAAQNPPPPTQEKPAPTMTGTWAIEATHSAGTARRP